MLENNMNWMDKWNLWWNQSKYWRRFYLWWIK